jgi:hypothetical protein
MREKAAARELESSARARAEEQTRSRARRPKESAACQRKREATAAPPADHGRQGQRRLGEEEKPV